MIKLNHYIQIILIIKQNQFILSAFWSKQKKVLQKFTYYHCSGNFQLNLILTNFRIWVFSTVWIIRNSFCCFFPIRSKHLKQKKPFSNNNHFQSVQLVFQVFPACSCIFLWSREEILNWLISLFLICCQSRRGKHIKWIK